jgi:hypothetical protein
VVDCIIISQDLKEEKIISPSIIQLLIDKPEDGKYIHLSNVIFFNTDSLLVPIKLRENSNT